MKHIVFDIETIPQDETRLLARAPEFAAAANLKDPEKIAAAVARKLADYLADAALNWKTAEMALIGKGGSRVCACAIAKYLNKQRLPADLKIQLN